MAEQRQDNKALEEAIEIFRADKEKDSFVKVMELLERSIVLVPALAPRPARTRPPGGSYIRMCGCW